jgi:hypothetical protein
LAPLCTRFRNHLHSSKALRKGLYSARITCVSRAIKFSSLNPEDFLTRSLEPSLADELSETAQSIMCKIEQVPTILSSLCQEILRNGLKVDFLFMTIPHDFQRYESVKSELSINTTHSYEDVYITVKLLQSFLEELPEPLVLYSLYSQAINFTAYLFNQAVDQLCNKHAIYKSLVQFTQVECYEDIWEYLWKPIQADNGKSKKPA